MKPQLSKRVAFLNSLPSMTIALILLAGALLFVYARQAQLAYGNAEIHIGPFSLELLNIVPSPSMLAFGAIALALVIAGVLIVDYLYYRRTVAPEAYDVERPTRPLRREITETRPDGSLRVTVLIPAHNEEHTLPDTLTSLWMQSRTPDEVWVIADNCTDRTAQIAADMGAKVYTTVNNEHKKAGGLNQLLAILMPDMDVFDTILVMDADTKIDPLFIENAAATMENEKHLSAVGGVFYGDDGPGLIRQLQRNEYARYSRDIARHQGKVFVLTGTATLFRRDALTMVTLYRGRELPGTPGQVYDTISLTEDNELTLALKTLGATMTSPIQCRVETELMPTYRDLWKQRERWQRGALENIGMYGLTSATGRYWMQQLGIGYSTVALNAYFLLMLITFLALGRIVFFPFWLLIGAIFVVERVATVWKDGWRARLLAAPLFIELAYDMFLQAVYVKSLFDIAFGRKKQWNHVKYAPQTAPDPQEVTK